MRMRCTGGVYLRYSPQVMTPLSLVIKFIMPLAYSVYSFKQCTVYQQRYSIQVSKEAPGLAKKAGDSLTSTAADGTEKAKESASKASKGLQASTQAVIYTYYT